MHPGIINPSRDEMHQISWKRTCQIKLSIRYFAQGLKLGSEILHTNLSVLPPAILPVHSPID